MKEKLVRNTSEKRWREYWKAVDAAASNAPTLRFHETKSSSQNRERARTKTSRAKKNR